MAFGIPAGTAMLEGDPIFTAPAPGGHGDRLAEVGTIGGDNGHTRRGTPRPDETIKTQVEWISSQIVAAERKAESPW